MSPLTRTREAREGGGMLNWVRSLPDSLQGLVIAGTLGLIVLSVALLIELIV
jgi:hypothetical protein